MTTYALTVHPKASPKAIFVEVPKMAPIELDTQLSYVPAVIAGSHPFAVGVVSVIALSSIYRSYKALPPSSATRDREPARKLHAQVFAALALLSLVVAGFYGAQFASLSYRVWAAERGVELPESIFGDKGAIRGGEHPGRLQFSKWLNDTPFYRDALEIVAEKARHFWWGQQVNLGLVSWSLYLAIEGRRRNISKLWAFLALSQLVNLSFAQNLFFAAVLLTPVPLPENVRELTRTSIPTSSRYSNLMAKLFPTKPDGFLPAAGPYAALLTINYTLIFLVPVAVNTPSFTAIAIASRILPFSILALPYLIPETWGTIHPHPHSAHSTYTMLFRTISTLSFLLHAKSTAMALFHNTPNAYYRHSVLHPFKEHRSALDRGSTAFSRVFGAFLEHPAVSYEGWDVILSGLSLGVWAAIRGLDAKEMLQSSIPFLGQPARDAGSTAKGDVAKIESNATPASITRRRRTKKSSEVDKDTTTISEKAKRSARPGNPIKPEDGDATYTPPADSKPVEEGDEEAEEDWEAASLGWGLMSVAGLGVGTAAILGGEVVGR